MKEYSENSPPEKKGKFEAPSVAQAANQNILQERQSNIHVFADPTYDLTFAEPTYDLTFADPTYDLTFKMLLGNSGHEDILISLLNNLLGFFDDQKIIKLVKNQTDLPISSFSKVKGQSDIASSVDFLCTNKGKQKIAIEIQGQRTKYFLAREQVYMSKLIASQVKEGEGKDYHDKVLDTYILVLGKNNIFTGPTAIDKPELFELDVEPTIRQTGEIVPGNKMHWKFFELQKFKLSNQYKSLNKDSPLKEQWLEFFLDCGNKTKLPDRDAIIKKGYNIMKVAEWSSDTKILYLKQKMNEESYLESLALSREEGIKEGIKEGATINTIEIAIRMIQNSMSDDIIALTTKLLSEQIIIARQALKAEKSTEVIIDEILLGGANDHQEDADLVGYTGEVPLDSE